jgi:formylglycine-generating enzyme required for sulfatase activity
MVGNIWEWTDADPNDEAPDSGYTWVFGGSFKHACQQNGGIARTNVNTNNSYAYLGFRCASDKT